MSTTGYIAYYDPEKDKYFGVYCHFGMDDLPEYLLKYYNTLELAKELVDRGDISYVGKEIGDQQDFNNPNPDWTLYYHRDRGEPWSKAKPKAFISLIDLWNHASRYNVIYVFANDQWHYIVHKRLVPITEAIPIEQVEVNKND